MLAFIFYLVPNCRTDDDKRVRCEKTFAELKEFIPSEFLYSYYLFSYYSFVVILLLYAYLLRSSYTLIGRVFKRCS